MEYVVSKLYRGGVVIPKSFREQLQLQEGEFIKMTILENGKVELEKIDITKK